MSKICKGTIKCFTDASYSQYLGTSVVGYKIGNNDVVTENLPNIKNTQAELYAVKKCIEQCTDLYPDYSIIIYTDCQRALKDEYPPHIKIEKIKGHKKKSLRDENDCLFSIVDKITRKELRKLKQDQ